MIDVGVWECELCPPLLPPPNAELIFPLLGFSEFVVAARSNGLTPLPPPKEGSACCPTVNDPPTDGVCAPVPIGVDKLDGNSDVKIVALEGEIKYFVVSVLKSASRNPFTFDPLPVMIM